MFEQLQGEVGLPRHERDGNWNGINPCLSPAFPAEFCNSWILLLSQSISLNSEMTEIVINGHKIEEVEKLLQQVGYVNSRHFPTPGYRTLTLNTQVQ